VSQYGRYKTLKGALLGDMEHECIGPGSWIVEGHRVQRRWPDVWQVEGPDGRRSTHMSFQEALIRVSELVGNGV
jgi:hypothetical protein